MREGVCVCVCVCVCVRGCVCVGGGGDYVFFLNNMPKDEVLCTVGVKANHPADSYYRCYCSYLPQQFVSLETKGSNCTFK